MTLMCYPSVVVLAAHRSQLCRQYGSGVSLFECGGCIEDDKDVIFISLRTSEGAKKKFSSIQTRTGNNSWDRLITTFKRGRPLHFTESLGCPATFRESGPTVSGSFNRSLRRPSDHREKIVAGQTNPATCPMVH